MDGGKGILLDENWLHIWTFVLDGACPMLPAQCVVCPAPPTLDDVLRVRVLESVCRAWARILNDRGVWRALYHAMVGPLRPCFPLRWYRIAALNFALGGVQQRDYVELTRPGPLPTPLVGGGYPTMKLPVWDLGHSAEDWMHVRPTADARLEPLSRAAMGSGWKRVKTVRRAKYDTTLHGDGRAVAQAWGAYCRKKAERRERESIMRSLRDETTSPLRTQCLA